MQKNFNAYRKVDKVPILDGQTEPPEVQRALQAKAARNAHKQLKSRLDEQLAFIRQIPFLAQ